MSKKIMSELKTYKGREIKEQQEVEVYRNLHNGGFSIRDKKTKLVIAHAPYVHLIDVKTHINEKDRNRVLKEKRKNVHAYVVGKFTKETFNEQDVRSMSYNPYYVGHFFDVETKDIVDKAKRVLCTNNVAWYVV